MDGKPSVGRRAQELARERKILRAALEELAQSDYGGLTIEAVAARSGVNKTTVYRKWADKAELIRAALLSVFEMFQVGPTAGNLRADLRRIARTSLALVNSAEGQSIMRLRLLQHPEPKLASMAKQLHDTQLAELAGLFQAAADRGELAEGVDGALLIDMLWGAIYTRQVMRHQTVDDRTLDEMVELLLKAARSGERAAPARRG
jgi:AcrR family transcriptional regulator